MSRLPLLALSVLSVAASSGCIIVIEKEHEWPEDTGYGGAGPGPGPGPGPEPIDDTGVACTDEAYASVVVDIVDPSGIPLPGARVTYVSPIDGLTYDAQAIEEVSTRFVVGWELEGDITINATLQQDTEDPCCWLSGEASTTVNVPMDAQGCHVETQVVTLTLDASELICADAQECG